MHGKRSLMARRCPFLKTFAGQKSPYLHSQGPAGTEQQDFESLCSGGGEFKDTLFPSTCLLSFHQSPGNRSCSLMTASESKQFLPLRKQESHRACSEQDDKEGNLAWFCLGVSRPSQDGWELPSSAGLEGPAHHLHAAQNSRPEPRHLPLCAPHLPVLFLLHLSTAGPKQAPQSPCSVPHGHPASMTPTTKDNSKALDSPVAPTFWNLLQDADCSWDNP